MIVTVIGVLTEADDDAHARRGLQRALPHLMRLWAQTDSDHEPEEVALLVYSPGSFSAANAGPVRDLMPVVSPGVRLAFSMSDDPEASQSRFFVTSHAPNWS